MKRNGKIKWLPGALLVSALMTGCEDERMNNIVNDKVYLVNEGLQTADVFNWEGFTYKLYVLKSGVGMSEADVELKVDAARLEVYNQQKGDSLLLLPEDSYALRNPKLTLGKDDYRVPFEVVFDVARIRELQQASRKRYAVPFVLHKAGGNAETGTDAQMFSLAVPVIHEPYLGFAVGGLSGKKVVVDHTSPAEPWFYAFVDTNYPHEAEVRYEVKPDPSVLEQYNKENDTDFRLFPAEAWSLDESSAVVAGRSSEQAFRFKIYRDKLKGTDGQPLSGDYYIPLRLTSVNTHQINPDKAVQLIPVVVQL